MSGAPEVNPRERVPMRTIPKRVTAKGETPVHPVLVIFCFLSGAFLFGVVGVIMAVPVALIVKITLALLYDEPAKDALASE
jgi:predicted PurR-regulated permease PerM